MSPVLGDRETHFIVSKTAEYLSCPMAVFVTLEADVPGLFHMGPTAWSAPLHNLCLEIQAMFLWKRHPEDLLLIYVMIWWS